MRQGVALALVIAGLVLFTGAVVVLTQGDPWVLLACALLGAGFGLALADDSSDA